ncbi:MAG: hypothetical protein FJZ04_00570 [Candidatus Moranbacteria bacterium]|nr:hypothetical protein [Candidatus Moranbacteria bacterium]
MDNIFAFGDSLTYGAWDEEGGWVGRLRKYIDEKNLDESSCFLYNLGISGNTSQDLISRFEKEVEARAGNNEENLFIVSVGVNDCMLNNETSLNNVSIENYTENLQKIIKLANNYSKKIVFVGFFPVDESKVNPIPWKLGFSYENKYVEKYNHAMKSVAKENSVYFIDIYKEVAKLDYKKFITDGVHPNSTGHKFIFEKVKSFLIKNKLISSEKISDLGKLGVKIK